ncbi:MAG: uracil-DNA glycosylase [Verrucomicrobiota bacterium]
MSTGLKAIHEELNRLQKEGVDRVFVDENTLELLKLPSAANPENKQDSRTTPIADLKELVKETEATEKKTSVKPAPDPSGIKPIPDTPATFDLPKGDAATQLAWLKERVESCPICTDHLSQNGKVVFGVGSTEADILFCGEAPGADEEILGEPFVGKAGQLLTRIIQAMGLQREKVYIANILKWRPEHDKPYGNRPPTIEEMNFCLPYVKAQIEIVKPKVIVALGNTAVTGFLGPDPNRRMGSARGTWNEFEGIPLMITFHPSYLLRNNTLKTKRQVWEDMLQVMEKVDLSISQKQRGFFLPKS